MGSSTVTGSGSYTDRQNVPWIAVPVICATDEARTVSNEPVPSDSEQPNPLGMPMPIPTGTSGSGLVVVSVRAIWPVTLTMKLCELEFGDTSVPVKVSTMVAGAIVGGGSVGVVGLAQPAVTSAARTRIEGI